MRDAGYDVRDYLRVASRYGTLNDFRELCDKAHACGMCVLLDFVPSQGLEYPWLRLASGMKNVYSDWYIWTDCMYDAPADENGKTLQHLSGWGEREGSVATFFSPAQSQLRLC